MTTNKKLVVTVGVMAVALILALTGIIVVLVTANQRASSAVNVKYTSSDVAVTLSATAYLGSNSYAFTKGGVVGGETELVLSPTVTEGSLSQTSDIASFDLTKTNDYVVFEYVFQNKTGNIDVKISQDGIPATKENINLTYTSSDTKITNFDTLDDNTEFTAQLLPAYTGEETVKYVYIKAQIADLLYDSSLVGDFGWALSKPQDSEVNTVTLNVSGADLVERGGSNLSNTSVASNYSYKTLASSVDTEDISIVPAVVDKMFIGWSETEGGTVISAIDMSEDETHNALRGTTAKTLYPIYRDGNVTLSMPDLYETMVVSGISDNTATEIVIPDITTYEGSIVKVTQIHSLSGTTFTSVFISNNINSIFPGAFNNCTGLTSITITGGITDIAMEAFSGCTGLTTVTFASDFHGAASSCYFGGLFAGCANLTSIVVETGNKIYDSRENCNALIETSTNSLLIGCKNTTIPSSVTSFGIGAFFGCSGLTDIIIPNGVTSIGENAFYGCSGLTSITIPTGVKSIGTYTFMACAGLTSVTIPNTVTSIGDNAFQGCTKLTSITIPNSVRSIGDNAFSDTGLTSLTIPNSVTSIGNVAFFESASLTSITIGSGVSSIGANLFADCVGLTSIVVDSANPYYDSRNNCNAIIETSTNTLLFGCKNSTIPNGVTTIGGSAFSGCTGLTGITIPNTVTTIGGSAFSGCTGLTGITIPNTVTTIGGSAFYGCTGLTSVTLPSNITIIEKSTFYNCTVLTGVTIPSGVTKIGDSAFYGCTALTGITIPANVTSIGKSAFRQCSGMTTANGGTGITFEDTTTWEKASNTGFTSNVSTVDVTDAGQNATWFVGRSGYYNYYWRKI